MPVRSMPRPPPATRPASPWIWPRHQFQSGYASYLALLNAEQTYQQALINLVQAQANRYADTAALFQALGGGWWHRSDLTMNLAR